MSMSLRVAEVTNEHVTRVAAKMRQMDLREIRGSCGENVLPKNVIKHSCRLSEFTFSVIDKKDKAIAIAGIVVGPDRKIGIPWVLATDELYEYKRELLCMGRDFLRIMEYSCEMLQNHVCTENEKSIRWLKRLGFEFTEPYEAMNGEMFRMFYR